MLDVMRKNAQSWVIKGLFIIIIAVFVLFWTDQRSQKGAAHVVVATVDKDEITLSEYQRSYDNLLSFYRNMFKEGLNDQMLQMLNLKEKALDNLIENRLLLKEAKGLGVQVSDSELIESISKYPAFQKESTFDKDQYLAVLRANALTPEGFEELQKRSLLAAKVEEVIKSGVQVSEDEAWEEFSKDREKVNLEFIKISPQDLLKDVKVTDEESTKYFSEKKDSFKISQAVKVEYLTIKRAEVEKSITPTEGDMREYYKKNIDLFKKPGTEETRTFEESFGEIAVRLRMEKSEDLLRERIYKAEEEARKEKGLSVAAASNGTFIDVTPFFTVGETLPEIGPAPEFYKEAFILKQGEISQPIKIQDGYMLFKVVERREERVPELGEVKEKVLSALRIVKAREAALKKGEELARDIKEGKAVLGKMKPKPEETGLFNRGGNIPKIGNSDELNGAAFTLTRENPAPLKAFEVGDAVYVVALKDRVAATPDEFKTEESSVRNRLLQSKKDEALKGWYKSAKAKAKIVKYEEYLR